MKASKIILLNGCSSAGKTMLAKAIQKLSREPFLFVGIDVLFGSMPRKIVGFSKEAEKGFQYVVDPKTDVLTEMKVSPYAGLVFSCLPKIVKLLANNGLNVIFDECNFHRELVGDYKNLFSGHKFLMVDVKCNLKTMEERELLRGDRVLGMARLFYQSKKSFNYPYDLMVDTTHTTPFHNARKILNFIKLNEPRIST